MKIDPRFTRVAATLALIAAVAVPMTASAVPGMGANKPPKANVNRSQTASARLAAKQQALRDRIAKVLTRRATVFDAAASRISTRIDRVATMAATAASAGGDVTGVTGVRAKLDAARAAIATAKATEAQAVAAFKAVPDETDRKAAFAAAKALAHTAKTSLDEARTSLRSAIMALKVVVNGLESVTP